MANTRQTGLAQAKRNKADEFYTQYQDIEKEVNAYLEYNPDVFRDKVILLPCDDPDWSNFTKYFAQNFERFGIKKLISTSYAQDRKPYRFPIQRSLFEINSPDYDESKTNSHGKIFTLTRRNKKVDINDLKWKYLEGDGDFRSDEVKALRDECDFVITNPMFSLFRDFLSWILEGEKRFLLIASINCITYREVFPLIRSNIAWLGSGMGRWISGFIVPPEYELHGTEARINEKGERIVSTNNCLWLTNIDHGRRHQPLQLMTMEDNLRFSSHDVIKLQGYRKYDNYDAIEVPFTDAIPSDYTGVMGVPVTFLDKYCPEQFEIMGCSYSYGDPGCHVNGTSWTVSIEGENPYKRLFIKKRG